MNATAVRKAGKSKVVSFPATPPWPADNDLGELAKVTRAALQVDPGDFFAALLKDSLEALPPYGRFSEFNIVNPWQPFRAARFLMDISIPASAEMAPDWARMLFPPFARRRLWRPTSFFRQPDEYGGVSSFPGEHWFFINGIGTNTDVARLNAAYVAHLFHRPVTVIQNSTRSLPLDLVECAVGKEFKDNPRRDDRKTMTEPAWRATAAILEALNAEHTRRVVVLAHSQGTIIMANVLRAIADTLQSAPARQKKPRWHSYVNEMMGGVSTANRKIVRDKVAHSVSVFFADGIPRAHERLAKLEIYTFANCADRMCYVVPAREIPYLEHFANELDLVARLGILSPLNGGPCSPIEIDGPLLLRRDETGHFLNEHYLGPIDEFLYPENRRRARDTDPFPVVGDRRHRSRLYEYFHGKTPVWNRRLH